MAGYTDHDKDSEFNIVDSYVSEHRNRNVIARLRARITHHIERDLVTKILQYHSKLSTGRHWLHVEEVKVDLEEVMSPTLLKAELRAHIKVQLTMSSHNVLPKYHNVFVQRTGVRHTAPSMFNSEGEADAIGDAVAELSMLKLSNSLGAMVLFAHEPYLKAYGSVVEYHDDIGAVMHIVEKPAGQGHETFVYRGEK